MNNKKLQEMINVSEEDRKMIKKTQLEILMFFSDYCKKNGLIFYLYGGTLLGAIRHKGYIPWDDDIDICMPRKDYDRFLHIFKSNETNYFIENHQTDKKYFLHFTKLMKKDTAYVEYTTQNIGYQSGIFIDIFPINGYPNKIINKLFYKIIVNMLTFKGTPRMPGYNKLYGSKKGAKKRALAIFFSKVLLFWCSKNFAIKMRDNFIRNHQYPNSPLCVSGVTFKRVMPKEYFSGQSLVTFENHKYPAPEKYDLYLKAHYGDYMKLPKESERVGHHYVVELKY